MPTVFVTGGFDDVRSRQVRFLEEAARFGPVHVLLWSDEAVAAQTGAPPRFAEAERRYLVGAMRYVHRLTLCPGPIDPDALPMPVNAPGAVWVMREAEDRSARRAFCRAHGLACRVVPEADLGVFPAPEACDLPVPSPRRKKILVTGSFDWFHSGHVRFFEEVSQLGDLYVVVGHDANIRLLKGEGHPLFPERERWYMVRSVRFVTAALISTGHGWLDAEPEIEHLRPDIYAVNEDGDRPEKRRFCEASGIEYRVLKRVPKEGLPRRQSTDLRDF